MLHLPQKGGKWNWMLIGSNEKAVEVFANLIGLFSQFPPASLAPFQKPHFQTHREIFKVFGYCTVASVKNITQNFKENE